MAGFAEWAKRWREERSLSQSEVARRVAREIGEEYTRDRVLKIEGTTKYKPTPEYPEPKLTAAYAKVLRRPITEALAAMGYDLPDGEDSSVSPGIAGVLADVPWEVQERLSTVISNLMGLAPSTTDEVSRLMQRPSPAISTEERLADRIASILDLVADPAEQERIVADFERRAQEYVRRHQAPDLAPPLPSLPPS